MKITTLIRAQKLIWLLLVFALLLAPGHAALADIVYGANDGGDQLIVFNTDTLTGSIVGPIGFGGVAGLTMDSAGVLYGLATGNPDRLLRIDPATGAGTLIGSTFLNGDLGASLANDPVTGKLFAVTGSIDQKFLITLSKDTGRVSIIAPFPGDVVGLEFDAAGRLWGIEGALDRLLEIDPATGDFTVIGGPLPEAIGGLTIGATGTFWAVDSSDPSVYLLYRIDPHTGNATLVGPLSGIPSEGPVIGLAAVTGTRSDTDGDGVPDSTDTCPRSDLSSTIAIVGCGTGVGNHLFEDGCTMADRIAQCIPGAVHHGDFVTCVGSLARVWKKGGLISGAEGGAVERCAAHAAVP